jgi:hypothetical protein
MPRRPISSAREGDGDKRRGHTFAAVEAIGRALPDVEVTTAWGQPALKVHGKMFVCIASHKSAAHTASSTSRCGASRTPAAAEARLGNHATAGDRS